jgi:hypothetical protein
VQIFNAAPASTKLARPTLREFFLRSAFTPSCLVDATGSISVVRAVRAVPAMVRVVRARMLCELWVLCVCHGTKLALLAQNARAAQECRDSRVHRMIRHIPLDCPWLPQQLHVSLSPPQSMSDGAEVRPPPHNARTYHPHTTHAHYTLDSLWRTTSSAPVPADSVPVLRVPQ